MIGFAWNYRSDDLTNAGEFSIKEDLPVERRNLSSSFCIHHLDQAGNRVYLYRT